jgi:hypothetical protein
MMNSRLLLLAVQFRANMLENEGLFQCPRFTQAGVSQRFGRAINLQICTNVRAGIHPRLRETARGM